MTEANFHVRAAKNTGLPLSKAPIKCSGIPPKGAGRTVAILILLISRLSSPKKAAEWSDLSLSHSTLTARAEILPYVQHMNTAPQSHSPQLACSGEMTLGAGRGKPRRTEATIPAQCPANKSGVSLKEKRVIVSDPETNSKAFPNETDFTGNRVWVNLS